MNVNVNSNMNNPYVISGKFGTKDIAREDLSTFMSSIKDFEWTDNNIYKPAKIVEVKPTFLNNRTSSSQSAYYQPKNINFDVFYVEENSHLQDFQEYKADIENRRVQAQDKIMIKKKEFIENFFPGEKVNETSDKKEILEYIKNNKSKIVMNSNLNSKLGKYIGYLNSQQNMQNANMNYNFEFGNKFK